MKSKQRVFLISRNEIPTSKTEQIRRIRGNTISRVQKNMAYHESIKRYDIIISAKDLMHLLSQQIPALQINPINASDTPTSP